MALLKKRRSSQLPQLGGLRSKSSAPAGQSTSSWWRRAQSRRSRPRGAGAIARVGAVRQMWPVDDTALPPARGEADPGLCVRQDSGRKRPAKVPVDSWRQRGPSGGKGAGRKRDTAGVGGCLESAGGTARAIGAGGSTAPAAGAAGAIRSRSSPGALYARGSQ